MYFPWKLNGWPICEMVETEGSGSGSGSGSSSGSGSGSTSGSGSGSTSGSGSGSGSGSTSGSGSGSTSGSGSGSTSGSGSGSTSGSGSGSTSGSGSGSTSGSGSGSTSGSGSGSTSGSGSGSTSGSGSGSGSSTSGGGGGSSSGSSSSGSIGDEYYAVIVICLKRADTGDCSAGLPQVSKVDSGGIEIAPARGLFPDGEYTDINGDVYTAILIGEKYATYIGAGDYYGTKTTEEWRALGDELCCGVKAIVKLDVHETGIGDYFPYNQKWEEVEECWTNPETGEQECWTMPGEYIGEGQSWSINGATTWCMMGTYEELQASNGWKEAGGKCISAVNAAWEALNDNVDKWSLYRTYVHNVEKGDSRNFNYFNWYGDYQDYNFYRNKRYGRLYVEPPEDLPPNSKTGVVLKLTIKVKMRDFVNGTWGVWAYLTQDEEIALPWGWKIPAPIVDNVPLFYDCGGENMYKVCPQNSLSELCAECEVRYTLLRYI